MTLQAKLPTWLERPKSLLKPVILCANSPQWLITQCAIVNELISIATRDVQRVPQHSDWSKWYCPYLMHDWENQNETTHIYRARPSVLCDQVFFVYILNEGYYVIRNFWTFMMICTIAHFIALLLRSRFIFFREANRFLTLRAGMFDKSP